MRQPVIAIFALSSLLTLALGQSNAGFVSPSGASLTVDKNYTIGQDIKLQWITTWSSISLCMTQYQHDNTSLCEWLEVNVANTNNHVWKVNTNRDWASNPRFHIRLFEKDNFNAYFWSPGFFIYGNDSKTSDPSSKSSSASGATKSPTSSKVALGSSKSSASGTAVKSSHKSSSGGPSTGAKIAIGVVVPVVFLVGCALAFFLFRKRRQRQSTSATPHDGFIPGVAENGSQQYTPLPAHEVPRSSAEKGHVDGSYNGVPQEVDGSEYNPPQEVDGSNYTPPQRANETPYDGSYHNPPQELSSETLERR